MYVVKKVVASSHDPKKALPWIMAVQTAKTWEELFHSPDDFDSLDSKISDGFDSVLEVELRRKLQVLEERLINDHQKMITGRQYYWFGSCAASGGPVERQEWTQ